MHQQCCPGHGKTGFGMFVSLGMNIVNIVGNYCFLYGPLSFLDLGTEGVAISTCSSRIFALVAAIIYFYKVIQGRLCIKYLARSL